MASVAATIIDQAIDWHLRQADDATADWPGFVAWLEADAGHAHAYDAVAHRDRLIGDAVFPITARAANDDAPTTTRRWWLGGAGGAAMAAALALVLMPSLGGGTQAFATADGEHRTVTLADGTTIAMNGGTALTVARGGRAVALERGEAMLRVAHDPAHPFTLTAGDQEIRDVGTAFDVTRSERAVTVAVAEGEVALPHAGGTVRLRAGDGAMLDVASGTLTRAPVAADGVGGWRAGLLSFERAALSDVAAALRRQEGAAVRLSGDLPDRPFTGTIRLTGSADRDIPHLADLIGATWRRDGKAWVLAAGSTAR